MMAKNTIQQTVRFNVPPAKVYEALINAKIHAAFTGAKAKIAAKQGGTFAAYDGYCSGVNIEHKKGKRIVQAWRAGDWREGEYSVATFVLESDKAGGTILKFSQAGVPPSELKSIEKGWKDFYWRPMQGYFSRK